jgi:hypothetical protein
MWSFFVLGIELHRERRKGVLGLLQKAYLEEVIKKYNMHACNPTPAPIVKGNGFGKFQSPRNHDRSNEMCFSYQRLKSAQG